jgi:hypothetical protein
MDAGMPAMMAGWNEIARGRIDGLHVQARDERLARAARASSATRRRIHETSDEMRQRPAAVTGGTGK